MTTVQTPAPATPRTGTPQAPPPAGVRLDTVVVGLLLVAAGVGWLLDRVGMSVPWRMFPAAALVLVGLALLASIAGGRRGGLVALGAVLLVVATAVGVGANRFAGPAGDLTVAPQAADWPVSVQQSAGNVTVDLTRDPLPAAGQVDVQLGAGKIVLVVPEGAAIRIEADVVTGSITVDGAEAVSGIDIDWSESGAASSAVVVTLTVTLGEIEVNHE